jgi:hypothetical protein
MALERPLASAFIDGGVRQRCLGVTMRRFSLWHLFLLRACDSPLVRLGHVELHDLQNAVGICRLRFPDSRIRRPRLAPWVLWRLCRKGGLGREVSRFVDYTGDYLSKPQYAVRPQEGAKPSTSKPAPELILVAGDVIGWTGWTDERVFNLPVGQAYWWQAMARRALGMDVDFETEHGRAFEAAMKEAGMKPA